MIELRRHFRGIVDNERLTLPADDCELEPSHRKAATKASVLR